MKIAFLHYHLRPGGVATVIRQQLEAIRRDCDVLLISGEPPAASWPAEVVHVPGIAYDGHNRSRPSAASVADSIRRVIYARWKTGCDLLHVHNPLLKKNAGFLMILEALQKAGLPLFMQIHDFAEDGRPQAYFKQPYPADCHYGVINSRDYRILIAAGLRPEGVHRIPNTVRTLPLGTPLQLIGRPVIYSTRAIRRKNLGEALLIAAFLKCPSELWVTLPPNSPMDIEAYSAWQRFSKIHRLPVAFDMGLKKDFSQLIASCSFLISTSISEGFGFSFLEPWTARKPVWGRNLPEITNDFKQMDIRLDHLYSALRVPLSQSRKVRLSDQWKSCVHANCRRFELPFDPAAVDTTFAGMCRDNLVDFGLLNESFQKEIIIETLNDPKFKAALIDLNPFLAHPGEVPGREALVEHNRTAVERRFNPQNCRDILMRIYESVSQLPVRHCIDKTALLNAFFNLRHFSLLKWGSYVE